MMSSLESGIPGLDDLFEQGFPKGKMILITGPPGSGKTVLCMQFLVGGALQGEPGIFVSFDDHPNHIRQDMQSFDWGDIKALEREELITIIDGFSNRVGLSSKEKYTIRPNVDSLLITLTEVLQETGATRIVIDSLTTLSAVVRSSAQVRKEILTMSAVLGEQGCTTLVTAELAGTASFLPRNDVGSSATFGVEEYSAQGSIILKYVETPTGELIRSLLIQKMRGTRHVFGWRVFDITDQGIIVYPDKTPAKFIDSLMKGKNTT